MKNNINKPISLAIIIPTYNRLENLKKVLREIGKSLLNCKEHVEVTVLDNNSSYQISQSELSKLSGISELKLITKLVNTGAIQNVSDAFSVSVADWYYVLGDSKCPVSNFIEKIFQDIKNSNEEDILLYNYDSRVTRSFTTSMIEDLIAMRVTFGDIILVGNSVISHNVIKNFLQTANDFSTSKCLVGALIFLALDKGFNLRNLNYPIIENFLIKPTKNDPGTNTLIQFWGMCHLLVQLPISLKNAKAVNKLIIDNENLKSRINFLKYSLLLIFREGKDIYKPLKFILANRFLYKFKIEEYTIIKILIFLNWAKKKLNFLNL